MSDSRVNTQEKAIMVKPEVIKPIKHLKISVSVMEVLCIDFYLVVRISCAIKGMRKK